MNLIKLKHVNVLLLEEIRRKLDKNFEKMAGGTENNENGEELNIDKIESNLKELNIDEIESNLVNNVILNLEAFDESCRRNTHLRGLDMFQQNV